MRRLLPQLSLKSYSIQMFGRKIQEPRLIDWRGDKPYVYSRRHLEPRPFEPEIQSLCNAVSQYAGVQFNHVLANFYRDGQDHMGWHRDNEPELGEDPVIASLSLGASRDFKLRRRDDKAEQLTLHLASGSLLIMKAGCQRYLEHCLPKRLKVQGTRLNLTFRAIV